MLCLPVFDTPSLTGNQVGLPAMLGIKHRPLTAPHHQQAVYKETPPLPRGSWPASDASPQASAVDRQPSPAGWLSQRITSLVAYAAFKFAFVLAAGLLCLTAAQAQTQAQLQAPSPAAAPSTGQDKLLEATRQWVAQTQQLAPAQVRFAALDSRVKVDVCEQALEMDYPFNPSRDTVRVRCPQTKPWQVFLRLLPANTPNNSSGATAGASKNPPNALVPPISPAAAAAAAAMPAAVQPVAQVATRPVVVTRRLIQRGTLLEASMLEVTERPALGLDPLVVSSLNDVERAESMRDIPAGTVLRSYDIKRALMVKKGQSAMLTVGQGSGFTVRVGVEAQQDGHLGEQIRLKNTESGRLLSGVVTGPNAVRALQN